MMEASSLNNESIALDTTFNNGYLKISKNYLPSGTLTTSNTFSRPRVIQWDPHMGTDQSTISVVLEQAVSDSSSPTTSDEIRPMKIVFGRLVVETNQQQQRAPTASPSSNLNSQLVWITLVAQVPRLSDTQVESGNQVPLSICVYDRNNSDTATDHWDFGVFTYSKGSGTEDFQGKKRGAPSDLSSEYTSHKRPNTSIEDEQLFNQLLAPFDESPGKSSLPEVRPSQSMPPQNIAIPPNRSAYHTPSSSAGNSAHSSYIQPNPYGGSELPEYGHQHVSIQPSPAAHPLGYGSYSAMPYPNYPHTQPQQGYGMSSHASASSSGIFPGYSQPASLFGSHPMQAQHSMIMPSISSSSTVSAHASRSNANRNAPPVASNTNTMGAYPFAGVLSKANLRIIGDLTEMTWNWSQEEWNNGRRLVQFWRRQHGGEDSKENEVECGFEAIEQETYQQQRIRENLAAQKDLGAKKPPPLVISCIYWRERNDYYITSVDCIYLLEGLIGVQFTVEEKNRIRRNLEGFRPLTVSKCKPECADFFKLIMGFPHPKPRNIEKDVKVFSWKTLPGALKKIIRKYTPSYSSTAVVNINQQ